jgi:lipoprotein-anchoring transpeptidase ErfK/SrfK
VKRFFLISAILLVAFGLLRLTINRTQTDFCANSISCVKNLTVNIENDENGVFNGQKVTPPKIDLATDRPKTEVLGESTATGEKHIYVDLTTQTLYAYQGQTLFMQTLISSGKWRATPPGDYRIWIKLRASRMTGGEGADFYDLPNVPYVMFFANNNVPESSGFSLHGAYWHNNFGHAMSHGCVNMRAIDAEKLYNWADPPTTGPTTLTSANNQGTEITIYGQAL